MESPEEKYSCIADMNIYAYGLFHAFIISSLL